MDKSINCMQCGNQFTITSHEQERLLSKGFDLPKRCPVCRKNKNRGANDTHEEWDLKRKRKQSRKGKDFFDDGI